jgi:DNA-binding transcriptional MerR regulator
MMSVTDGARHRVGEIARLTGVSIRTLHHYDHLGLLSPSGRSDAGYRLCDDADLLRLQQILTLRYLGFQLAHIGELLSRSGFDVAASLRIQRRIMRRRIGELQRIDTALEALLAHRRATGDWGWQLVVGASAAAPGTRQKG